MFWLRVYPIDRRTTAQDLRLLFAPCGYIAGIIIRSARWLGKRYKGMNYATLHVPDGIDAIRMRNSFHNTTFHKDLSPHPYQFVPAVKFGPYTFRGTLHVRFISPHRTTLGQGQLHLCPSYPTY